MLAGYYKLWVDAIASAQRSNSQNLSWKLVTITAISALQGINLLTILLFIRALSNKETLLLMPLHIFHLRPLNIFLSVLITYFFPFVILNYLLIFSNNQYVNLLNRYKDKDGKLFRWYIYITVGIIAIPLIFKLIF